ncbi:hypothetical protein BFL35_02140 [Clavibacter michiganensis]|nr:hypothetical protein BFL35_02140 [Clavibacter michiganensis]
MTPRGHGLKASGWDGGAREVATAADEAAGTRRPEEGKRPARGRTAVALVCSSLIAYFAGLLMFAMLPALFGAHATTVMTTSLEPLVPAGSVVVVMPVRDDTLTAGRVVQLEDERRPGRMLLQRMPDAGSPADVSRADVRGAAVMLIPYVGIPIRAAYQGDLITLVAVVVALTLLGVGARLHRSPLVARPGPGDRSDGEDMSAAPSRSTP